MPPRLQEALAIFLIGDGLVAMVEPRRHTRLWMGGPAPYRQLMETLERQPRLAQIVGAAQVVLGLWWASRQRPS